MKANELRIGNYVKFYRVEEGNVIEHAKINTVHEECCVLDHNKAIGCALRVIKPIPLTEQWLLDLGFYEHDEHGMYGDRYFTPIADYNYVVERDWREETSYFFGIEYTDSHKPDDDGEVYFFSFEVKYVHQLQNLYFALTGEELTLNKTRNGTSE
jgi:hypothetical protein